MEQAVTRKWNSMRRYSRTLARTCLVASVALTIVIISGMWLDYGGGLRVRGHYARFFSHGGTVRVFWGVKSDPVDVWPSRRRASVDFNVGRLSQRLPLSWKLLPASVPIEPGISRRGDYEITLWPIACVSCVLGAMIFKCGRTRATLAGEAVEKSAKSRKKCWAKRLESTLLIAALCGLASSVVSVWLEPKVQLDARDASVGFGIGRGLLSGTFGDRAVLEFKGLQISGTLERPLLRSWTWWPPIRVSSWAGPLPSTTFTAALWLLVPTLFGLALLVHRFARQQESKPGHCESCGYSLLGLSPNTPCPECGSTPLPPIAADATPTTCDASAHSKNH